MDARRIITSLVLIFQWMVQITTLLSMRKAIMSSQSGCIMERIGIYREIEMEGKNLRDKG